MVSEGLGVKLVDSFGVKVENGAVRQGFTGCGLHPFIEDQWDVEIWPGPLADAIDMC